MSEFIQESIDRAKALSPYQHKVISVTVEEDEEFEKVNVVTAGLAVTSMELESFKFLGGI